MNTPDTSGQHYEKTISRQEPGIVRNSSGRIIQTGYPTIPSGQWPRAYNEITTALNGHVDIENFFLSHGTLDNRGAYRIGPGIFHISSSSIQEPFKKIVDKKLKNTDTSQKITVCDMGGGDGTLLGKVVKQYDSTERSRLETTLTSLVDFPRQPFYSDTVDNVVITSAELPPTEFYESFDVIAAQNSIYFWTDFPELATGKVAKMLKPGGIFIATIPLEPQKISNEQFDMISYLKNNPHLRITKPSMDRSGKALVLEMEKMRTTIPRSGTIFSC